MWLISYLLGMSLHLIHLFRGNFFTFEYICMCIYLLYFELCLILTFLGMILQNYYIWFVVFYLPFGHVSLHLIHLLGSVLDSVKPAGHAETHCPVESGSSAGSFNSFCR